MANLQMVRIDLISFAEFNPPTRTDEKRLKKLKKSMEEHGQLDPITITSKMELVDGHRRVTCAKLLGWTDILAIVHDGKRDTLWSEMNGHTEPIKANQWVQASHLGFDISLVPQRYRYLIELARSWLGDDGLTILADKSKSTDVIRQTLMVAKYVDVDDEPSKAKILKWLVKHNTSFVARRYVMANQPSELLLAAIDADRPLVLGYTIG